MLENCMLTVWLIEVFELIEGEEVVVCRWLRSLLCADERKTHQAGRPGRLYTCLDDALKQQRHKIDLLA
jgi:hypothetical protein